MERVHTFIDVDENRLELWLKPDRIQLVVIDSRPELEAGELRRFASAVFTEYVGRDLAVRLSAARRRLREARDAAGRAGTLDGGFIAALDGALAALDDAAAAVAVPPPVAIESEPEPEPEPALTLEPAFAPPPPPAVRELTGRVPYLPLRPGRRGKRAGEGSSLVWHSGGAPAVPGVR